MSFALNLAPLVQAFFAIFVQGCCWTMLSSKALCFVPLGSDIISCREFVNHIYDRGYALRSRYHPT